jgi:predicted dinucleotide-binding enzyme
MAVVSTPTVLEENIMLIGIIGAGKIGSTLAKLFVDAGHEVAIANSRGPDTLRDLETDLGDRGHATTATDAARHSDLVVVAVPFKDYHELPVDGLAGKTVVDACNYYPERDGPLAELDNGHTTSSELIQNHLTGACLVKAFNAMRFDHLREYGHEAGANQRYGIPVSGDDDAAKRDVFDLVEQLGFEPVDAGDLANGGRHHQPGADVYLGDLFAEDLRARLDIQPA